MTRALDSCPGSLLPSLRYPHQDIHGMAAWGPDSVTGRAHAWVKWDGKSIGAEWAGASVNGTIPEALSARWVVDADGRLTLDQAMGTPLLPEELTARFSSIPRTDCPSFITLPRPPRGGF